MSRTPPCAACKLLRRKCTSDCVFAPYFPRDNPTKFPNLHKVYGASNLAKLLNELGTDSQRSEAVRSLVYEAECRIQDPVHGCVGYVAILQKKLSQVYHDLECAKKELSTYIVPSEMLPQQQPQQNFVQSVYQMMPSHVQQMMDPMGVPLPHRGQLVIREPNLQEQQHQQPQILEAQQLMAMVAAMEEETLKAYKQQQLQHQQLLQQQGHDLVRFNNVSDDGAGPSTATGFNEMPEEAAAMQLQLLRAYELQQLQHQQLLQQQQGHGLVRFKNVFDDGAGPSTATGFNEMPEEAAAMEKQLLSAYEQQQLQYQQLLQQQQQGHDHLVRFKNVFDDGAGPSTATGFNEMPEEAAAMEKQLLMAYEQQQLQYQQLLQQQQGQDHLVRFKNVFDDGAGPSTATGFNEMPEEAAGIEEEMLRDYEQQQVQHPQQQQELELLRAYEQQQLQHQQQLEEQQQQGHDLVKFNNVFDDGAGPSTATGFDKMREEAAAEADDTQPFLALGGSYETNPYHHIQHHNLAQEHSFFPSHPHTDDSDQLQLVATEERLSQQQ